MASNTGARFTPGPWRLADNDRSLVVTEALDADGNCTVVADALTAVGSATAMDLSNARLIAAAPQLYEALSNLIVIAGTPITARQEEVFVKARAALAKARGDS